MMTKQEADAIAIKHFDKLHQEYLRQHCKEMRESKDTWILGQYDLFFRSIDPEVKP